MLPRNNFDLIENRIPNPESRITERLLKEFAQLTLEARDDVAQVEQVGFRLEYDFVRTRSGDSRDLPAGIHNDDEEHALRQILLGFCVYLARAIVWRQHLDSHVRRALDEPASACRRRHALASCEGDVGSSHCVGVRCQLEADLCADHPDRMLLEMTTQKEP